MSEREQGHRSEASGARNPALDEASGGEGSTASDGHFENPVPDWDRFTITDFIGAGSMGRVYRAVDRRLTRPVALKFLRSDDPEQVRRFQGEASSQAQIDHDHVCRIYDVGEVEDMPYIAMQYIDGRSLSELTDELTLETKVRLMEQVAEGAQAAHSIGVVHRDIKPENIMVERSEGGGYHAYVLDFGIAREIGAPSLTMRGVVVGTPAYMAPEQIKGDPDLIDRRVDVYGMGATLYDLIGGAAPFSGSTRIETLMQVLSEEPQPLRQLDGRIPIDLETIVSKCLEKDPQRRYASARALGDDLRRYLDGEAIAARSTGLAYRFTKFVLRHRAAAAVAAAATLVVLTLVGALIWQSFRARRGAEIAQQFGREIEGIHSMLRQAHMLPLHDPAPIEARVRKRMAEIEARMTQMGSVARAPGSHSLGIGHLALGELDAARARLEEAWQAGQRSPELEGALGRVLGEIYLEEAEAAARIRNADLRQARLDAIERDLLEPALHHLRLDRTAGEGRNLHRAALAALLVRQFDLALELARRSYERHPWLYESMRLEAETLVSRAQVLEERGQTDEARKDLSDAGEIYAMALDVGRSDASLYRGEAARLIRYFNLEQEAGDLREDLFDRILEATEAATIAQPDDPRPFNLQAKAYWMRGDFLLNTGRDPSASLEKAVELAERAGRMEPDNPETAINLGMIHRLQASFVRRQGEDPRPLLERAAAACRRAIAADPNSAVAWLNLGTAHYLAAAYELASGIDPGSSLEQAGEAYEQSVLVRPTFAAYSNSGLVHWQRAEYEEQHGEDPGPSLEAAARSFERAIELNPSHAQVHSNRGLILLERAEREGERGGDPTPWVERALAVLERAVELMPKLAAAHNNLGNAHKMLAVVQMTDGEDPRTGLERAIAAYERAIALDPSLSYQYNNLGYAWELKGEYAALSGSDPLADLKEARTQLERALELEPTLAFAHHNLAVSYLTEAEYLVDRGQEPTAALRRGRRQARAAVEDNPELWDLRLMEAQLDLVAAEWALERDQPVAQLLAAADRRIAAAEELNPVAQAVILNRAEAALLRARWQLERGFDPTDEIEIGLSAVARGLEIDSSDAGFYLMRGRLLLLEARAATDPDMRERFAADAAEALTTAENINPLLDHQCAPLLAEALRAGG